jgi:hypothetical protein
MLRLAQVPHQKMTMIVDEGLLGSCDPDHMSQVVKQLLPALGVRLFMITHHEELRAAMTHTIPLGTPKRPRVNHGDAREPSKIEGRGEEEAPRQKRMADEPARVRCDVCSTDFKSEKMLERHLRSDKHAKAAKRAS